MSQPVALTINVHNLETPKASLPAALEARLTGSPTKSPEDLASALQAHANRTAALRKAHLDAVRDRAARESQRAADVAARKLRLAANRVEKIQSRIDMAATKTHSKKEAAEAEREARKARRESLAQAVADAREAADQARAVRHAEILTAEAQANAKHLKAVGEVKDKGAAAVKHALAVAAAQKEKEAEAAALLAEKQCARLNAADYRREELAALAMAGPGSPGKAGAKAARALNDAFNAAHVKGAVHEARCSKAEANRAAHLKTVQDKAAHVSAKAAAVVAKAHDKTDAIEAAKTLYDRLLRAETARLSALKAKYATGGAAKSKKAEVFVVRVDVTPRSPPAALTLRLSAVSKTLTKTAGARQAAASARRDALRHARIVKAAEAKQRRAAAAMRVARAAAAVEAKVQTKAARGVVTHALAVGARQHRIAEEHKRAEAATEKREAAATAKSTAQAARLKAEAAASERHGAVLRGIAKVGVVAVRAAAQRSRREALDKALHARFLLKAQRCAEATAKRAALLAARVEVARKRMKAMHPKRDMPDETVQSTYSEA